MQAIILAAGMGRRLQDLTMNNTKCMIKVNEITLVERTLRQLDCKQLNRIIIVVGYEGQKLVDFIQTLSIRTPIEFIENQIYAQTNNIYSLALAKEKMLEDDTLLLESDIIFERAVLDALLDDPRETLALVDRYESWMDGTVVKLGENDSISAFIPGKQFDFREKDQYYKTVNLYKFSQDFSTRSYVPFLEAYQKALGLNEYYEQVLRVITMLDNPGIAAKRLNGEKWYEIDDVQDLDIAISMFAEEEQLSLIQERFGGYWRYPKLLDFCYLVNPYYPPQKMKDEIRANFDTLITAYPSGMRVNALLAARNFGVHENHIVVGNGAAELIKELLKQQDGALGIIRPTFEEYPNRYHAEREVVYTPQTDDFSYTAQDLISFFDVNAVSALVLINPDNPSGNYICKNELLQLATWADECNIHLIVDESFADFSDEENCSLLDESIINQYPKMSIVKSISKSYGVPGLRLGILASGNESRISKLKKAVSIWNINSFAEFYMQIFIKYEKDYLRALKQFQTTRTTFCEGLAQISYLRPFPTQANYVMAEVMNGKTSAELTQSLLTKKILIKDLTPKIKRPGKEYIRIAVRNEEENDKLLSALSEL